MIDYSEITQSEFSYLSKGSKIIGTLHLSGATRLSSQVEGEIITLENSPLIIELEGRVKGEVSCADLDVYGEIDGLISSTGKVTLYPSAIVSGQITTKSLVIHPGAQVQIKGHTIES